MSETRFRKYWEERGKSYFFEGLHPNADVWYRICDTFLKHMKTLKFNSLIEIGCGVGDFLKVFRVCFPKIEMAGIDLSSTMIATARKRVWRVEFRQADLLALPFGINRYDLATTNVVLIHIPPALIKNAITEILRVAKEALFCETSVRGGGVMDLEPKPEQLYFPHDYPKVFEEMHLDWKLVETIDPSCKRCLYHVKSSDVKKE